MRDVSHGRPKIGVTETDFTNQWRDPSMPESADHHVHSVTRAHELIELLKEFDGAGVTELAEHVDLAKSTVHKYLTTLNDLGYVVKQDDTYHLGLKYLDLGMYARDTHPAVELSRPSLRNLVEETDEIGWCTCEENGQLVTLDVVVGDHDINQKFKGQIGNREYLHPHAGGKAILAEYSDARVDQIVDAQGLPQYTDRTITDRDELFAELDEIRATGVAFNDEEAIKGYRAVGASVTQNDSVIGSITIGAPKSRLNESEFTDRIPELIRGAINEIELRGSVESPWK